jgi:CHAT domain-containing protein
MRRLGLCVASAMIVAVAAPMPAAATPQTASQTAQQAVAPIDARFASCAPKAGQTWTYDRLNCLYVIGRQQGLLAEAQALLRRLGAEDPDRPWPTLVLAYTMHQQDQARALQLYQLAAEGFVRAHDAEGEVIARHNLRTLYWLHGRVKEATQEVAKAVAAAEASQHRIAIARAAVLEANHLIETGGDLGRAYRSLMQAQPFAFPKGPIGLRRALLIVLANTCTYLGRLDEAIDALERHRRLRQEDGSLSEAATVAYNLLNARLTKNEMHPVGTARERLTLEAQDVLAEAQRLDRPMYLAYTHRVLADLLRTTDPAAAGMHIERCVELATSLAFPLLRAQCLWSQSRYEATRNRARAEDLSRQAFAELSNNPSGPLIAYAWQARMRLVWQTAIGEEEQEQAITASLDALDAIERLRSAQKDEGSRATMFSNWTGDYRYLTGRLLSARTPASRLPRAFEVGERLRARVLLEHLTRAGVASQAAPFASLEQIQHALDDDEAMLWFSIAPWEDIYGEFGGGAWLIAVRRDAVSVHRLSSGSELESQVAALVGLLRDRDVAAERWEKATERLGQVLLGEAIAELPPNVQRLVIVSDGELHRLPFEVLRPVHDQSRLGERFEIAVAPSATLWLHLRQRQQTMLPGPASNSALVLADPDLPRGGAIAGAIGGATGDQRLERLPWARHEARAIADALRLDAGRVREGGAASERFLKHVPLASASVLHLAAHARADETLPDRSAIFLAPGDASEDGWLQPREIASLGLQGQLVVLSACDSAGGFLLSGEGPLSLARAFFAGGAGVVVATRWPLRDDDAAFVMERFYRALAAGSTVGAALHAARREAIEAKRPAAAWAGLVLLGDGLRAPFSPPPRQEPLVTSFAIEAAIGIGVIIVLISLRSQARVHTRREG